MSGTHNIVIVHWINLAHIVVKGTNQNGPNEGRKRPTETKTAPMEEKNMTKTAPANIQNGPLRNIVQISDKWCNYKW